MVPLRRPSWFTLEQAACALDRHKSQVSRYVRDGRLVSNGKRGSRELRIDPASIAVLRLEGVRTRRSGRRTQRDTALRVRELEQKGDIRDLTEEEQAELINTAEAHARRERARRDYAATLDKVGEKLRQALRLLDAAGLLSRRKADGVRRHLEAVLELLGR